jgi:transposase-like protein
VPAPPRRRRSFSPADKLRIVREADAATERGQIEALCRREGIYSSHLAAWRKALALHGEVGLGARKPGRKATRDAKDVRIEALEKRAARLERDLDVARKVIGLQKKLSEILGIQLPPLPEDE